MRLSGDSSWELIERHGWLKLLFVSAVFQFAFYFFDLYSQEVFRSARRMLAGIAGALCISVLVLMVIFYWAPFLAVGRGLFFLDLAVSGAVIVVWRLVLWSAAARRQLNTRERVLILGSGKLAIDVARATLERSHAGLHIVGFVDDKPELVGKSLINPSVIGLTADLPYLVRQHRIDRIVVAMEDRRGHFPIEQLLNLRLGERVAVEESACYYERLTGKVRTEQLRPSWLIFSQAARRSGLARRTERAVNSLLAAAGFLLAIPIMLLVALVVKLESQGPILYMQERVGKNGRTFKIIKFRSMCVGAESRSGPVWAGPSDARVTRVGRVIRKLRLDELPQFLNVLRGDMNFIGPRPERPEFVAMLSQVIPYYSQRHLIEPGITGWAQISYPYGASVQDAVEKLQYDLYYIKNRSLRLDAMIVFETIKIVLFGRGAR
jgi:sugar transferase (PEP-CTERM system associated)